MNPGDSEGVLGLEGPPPPLRITNFPLLDQGWTAWAVLIAAAGCGVAGGYLASNRMMGGVLACVFVLTLWRLWLPVRFEFGPTGVTQVVLGRPRTVSWTRIVRYEVKPRGVMLLGSDDRSPLAAFQGLYVHWGKHRDQLLAVLAYYLDPPDAQRMSESTRTNVP